MLGTITYGIITGSAEHYDVYHYNSSGHIDQYVYVVADIVGPYFKNTYTSDGHSVGVITVTVEFDGTLDLPWATYGSGARARRKVGSFDGSAAHDFMVKAAEYRPGVIADWGGFHP